MCGLYLLLIAFVCVAIHLKSHSIDASQCSDAVCKALYEDLLPFVERNKDLLTFQQELALEELASCYSGNVVCDKREELENAVYQVLEGLVFELKETPKLAPYFSLCRLSLLK